MVFSLSLVTTLRRTSSTTTQRKKTHYTSSSSSSTRLALHYTFTKHNLSAPLLKADLEQVTFRFVAQHLNHCATAVPYSRSMGSHNTYKLYSNGIIWPVLTCGIARLCIFCSCWESNQNFLWQTVSLVTTSSELSRLVTQSSVAIFRIL